MEFKIVYKKSVIRDLKKIDKNNARRILDRLEKDLAENADSYPALKGYFAGLRKYRVGDYRVIFVVIEEEVTILRIAHRKKSYKK